MLDDQHLFRVTDLKQYAFCARVIYYERLLPHVRPRTIMMDAGKEAHEDEAKRAARRTLAKYDVLSGQRQFDVRIESETLWLSGLIDEVVHSADGEIFPVDYKLADKAGRHHHVQLTAYALLIEEAYHTTVKRGFIYLLRTRKLVEVPIKPALREQVQVILAALHHMIATESMPPLPKSLNFCPSCEFRRFCNDV